MSVLLPSVYRVLSVSHSKDTMYVVILVGTISFLHFSSDVGVLSRNHHSKYSGGLERSVPAREALECLGCWRNQGERLRPGLETCKVNLLRCPEFLSLCRHLRLEWDGMSQGLVYGLPRPLRWRLSSRRTCVFVVREIGAVSADVIDFIVPKVVDALDRRVVAEFFRESHPRTASLCLSHLCARR